MLYLHNRIPFNNDNKSMLYVTARMNLSISQTMLNKISHMLHYFSYKMFKNRGMQCIVLKGGTFDNVGNSEEEVMGRGTGRPSGYW